MKEEAERVLAKRERQLNIQGSKVHYKKKLRLIGSKTHDRYQPQQQQQPQAGRVALGTSPSTPEVLSTSPEAAY